MQNVSREEKVVSHMLLHDKIGILTLQLHNNMPTFKSRPSYARLKYGSLTGRLNVMLGDARE